MKDFKFLYPELELYDGLPLALQSELSKVIPDLQYVHGISFSKLKEFAEEFERVGVYHSSTRLVSENGRWADVDIAVEQKLYILTLGDKYDDRHLSDVTGVFLEVSILEQVIVLLTFWLSNRVSIATLETMGPFVNFLNLEDDTQYIRWQWASRYRQAVNHGIFTQQLVPLFYEAMHDPVLSQITPYTSHSALFLSRYTEFPFDSGDYPVAAPLLSLGLINYWRSIVRKQNIQNAEKEILEIPSKIGQIIHVKHNEYQFISYQKESVFRDDPLSLLESIIEFMRERYEIVERKGGALIAENSKQAVVYLRNALPTNWHRSIRGSSDSL